MEFKFSEDFGQLFSQAKALATKQKQKYVDLLHLLLAMLQTDPLPALLQARVRNESHLDNLREFFASTIGAMPKEMPEGAELTPGLSKILTFIQEQKEGITTDDFVEILLASWDSLFPFTLEKLQMTPLEAATAESPLTEEQFIQRIFADEYNLNLRFKQSKPHLGIDFSATTNSMMEVLIRRYRHNVLLYGHPGSGRSTALQQLIHRINSGKVPASFRKRVLYEFHLELFLSNLSDNHDLVQRLRYLANWLHEHPQVVLVFEDLDKILANLENALMQELFNRLMHLVADPDAHFIFITDLEFFNNTFNTNSYLQELFTPLYIRSLQLEEVQAVLEDSVADFHTQYGIEVKPEWIQLAVEYADRFIRTMQFPKKAIHLLDIVLSKISVQGSRKSVKKLFQEAVAEITGEPFLGLEKKQERINRLEEVLGDTIIGQEAAIHTIASHLRITRNQLDTARERPDGVFLFVGPMGVGKRKLAREISLLLYGREPLILSPFDFQVQEENEKVTIKHQRSSVFEKLKKSSNYLILLEDMHEIPVQVLEMFMKASEAGVLHAPSGEKIHISNTTIVFLMNVTDLDRSHQVGFHEATTSEAQVERYLQAIVEESFSEEFRVKMDRIVFFQPLSEEHIHRIVTKVFLPEFKQKIEALGHTIQLNEPVINHIVTTSSSRDFNAHHVLKSFQKLIVSPVGDLIFKHHGESFSIRFKLSEKKPTISWRRRKNSA
ncbi:MAG: AAA family ATPase [Candidatus Delongbacteria bacterium]|nr:AAA family ATPase [Candidatus Delongbacteria bacterium]